MNGAKMFWYGLVWFGNDLFVKTSWSEMKIKFHLL